MFYLKEWNEHLDLNEFYLTCAGKGYMNNCSQKRLVGSIQKEKEWNCWILYSGETAIGSVAAHSFDDVMGPNTYRILARTCAFTEYSPIKNSHVVTRQNAKEHQHFTDQFFFPVCLEWAGNNRVFATSNSSDVTLVKTERLIHNYYFPLLESLGLVTRISTFMYKNTPQTVWEIHKEPFLSHLNQYPRWALNEHTHT